jgi:hypothetical protein
VSPAVRRARAALLAAVIFGLGAGFHFLAGGRLPGVAGVTLLGTATYAVAGFLVRRPASRRRIVAIAVTGQAAVHAALTAAAGHGHQPAATTAPDGASAVSWAPGALNWTPGSLGEALQAPALTPPGAAVGPDPVALALGRLIGELTPDHLLMAAAHAGAALLVGLWLAGGEAALLTLLALAVPLRRPQPAVQLPAIPRLPVAITTVAIPDPLTVLSSPGRRGPPVVAAF